MNPSNKLTRSLFFHQCCPLFYFADAEILLHGSTCSDSFLAFCWDGRDYSPVALPVIGQSIVDCILVHHQEKTKVFDVDGCSGFLFAGSFLLFDQVLANEAGHLQTITEYRFGFWLWLGSTLSHAGICHLLPFTCWTWKGRSYFIPKSKITVNDLFILQSAFPESSVNYCAFKTVGMPFSGKRLFFMHLKVSLCLNISSFYYWLQAVFLHMPRMISRTWIGPT